MNIAKMKVNPHFDGILTVGRNPSLSIMKSEGEYGDVVRIDFRNFDVLYTFRYSKEDVETIIEYMRRWIA